MNFEQIMDFNKPYNKLNIDSLIKKIQSNSIIPYVGAGMSILFENVYPSWSGFLYKTFEKFIDISEKNKFDNLNYEDKADFLYSEMGQITFAGHLKETFGEKHLDRESIDFIDKSAYILPIIFENGLFITTNYDRVIEKTYLLHEKFLTVVHPGHYEALNRALRDGDLLLYKIHGDIAEPETSIILTKEQYENAYANPNLIQALKNAYMSKEILFLGCSMTKDRPIELLCKISQAGMKNYAIISCNADDVKARRLQLENEFFTQAIIYPEGRHECLKVLLDYIAKTTNPQVYQRTMKKYFDKNKSENLSIELTSETDYNCGENGKLIDENADRYFEKSAKQRDANTQNKLENSSSSGTDHYYSKNENPNDYEKAVCNFEKAAKEGDAIAQNNLGDCYLNGDGVEKDYKKAVFWYTKAAEQGNASAQKRLGDCYDNGWGVEEDKKKAAYWYKKAVNWYIKAAEHGDASAQESLGDCYFNGRGVEEDYKKALHWYTKAAEQGFASTQYLLGDLNFYGGGAEEVEKAMYWYTKAAEQGYASAEYTLGWCYKVGQGVDKDDQKAVYWYTKAAEHGDACAQNELGECYYNGDGVRKDYMRAKELWEEASINGSIEAIDNLELHFGL